LALCRQTDLLPERELIAAMHGREKIKSASDQAFMRAMAKRADLFAGHHYC
jgi:hypothetical protein